MAEAEEMQQQTAGPAAAAPPDYSGLRDAIADISKQDSQSAILKSLISHAAKYAARGAFFIIKNEHFVGWKVFGDGTVEAESAVRDIHFPTADDSVLGAAVRSLDTTQGTAGSHSGNGTFLEPIHFGQPDRYYAVPLVARGRGVAVMYVDSGSTGSEPNVEALETLVRIAGLTVELLAATHTAGAENRQASAADFEQARHEQPEQAVEETTTAFEQTSWTEPEAETPVDHEAAVPGYQQPAPEYSFSSDDRAFESVTEEYSSDDLGQGDQSTTDYSFTPSTGFDTPVTTNEEPYSGYSTPADTDYGAPAFASDESQVEHTAFSEPAADLGSQPTAQFGSDETSGAMMFDSGGSVETVQEPSPFETAAAQFEPAVAVSTKPEAAIEVSASNTGFARLSDRPVDLPIQVPEEERRLHNDARRFARLLVSEIKLYNEKKVQEGRQAGDLYERLREAIDRSREMYDKRVQPPVAAKFDYFHYELVNALADGEVDRLGNGYPGSKV
jgi:hypothetical protein